MTDKLINFGSGGLVLSGAAQAATFGVASAPIFLAPGKIVVSNTVSFNTPGAGAENIDLAHLLLNVVVTDKAGTDPTLTAVIQGTSDPFDNNTTTTAALTDSGTTLALTTRTGIAQYAEVLLMEADGSKYEWVRVTSSATTGAGNHTITRNIFGEGAKAFSSGAYAFFTNSWADIPTNDGTTATLTTGAIDISSAAAAAPATGSVDTNKLDMSGLAFPVIRVRTTVGGTSSPTATYKAFLSGRKR
jgi:hypothetical protein